jgi:hypothetical protein
MPKIAWIVTLAAALTASTTALAQTPDLRGTWKGESESIIMGAGNPHHAATPSAAPRLNSVAFTLPLTGKTAAAFPARSPPLAPPTRSSPSSRAAGRSTWWTTTVIPLARCWRRTG